jgi:A/G-specific adenine glycosylase
MPNKDILAFQKTIWDFYRKNKRNFPWRDTKNPYHILVSEIMLQQTQANRVVRYYQTWLKRFPTFSSLAKATFSDVYPYWQGLGYNRRAMALKKLAEEVVQEYQGNLPNDIALLEKLPGIGPYTARAVSIFSFNTSVTCIETNIRRVFIYHFFDDKTQVTDEHILEIAERALPAGLAREWHYALMDYGAYLKSLPAGKQANRRHKHYAVQSTFEGSLRQIRGAALKIISVKPIETTDLTAKLKKATSQTKERIEKVMNALEKERLVKYDKKRYSLN